MADCIHCDALRCIHNSHSTCGAGIIQVGGVDPKGHAGCTTYATPDTVAGGGAYAKRFIDAEIAKEMLFVDGQGGTAILCSATPCAHNRDFRCAAHDIQIGNHPQVGSAATRCDSYVDTH